jgi:hypothetical protein
VSPLFAQLAMRVLDHVVRCQLQERRGQTASLEGAGGRQVTLLLACLSLAVAGLLLQRRSQQHGPVLGIHVFDPCGCEAQRDWCNEVASVGVVFAFSSRTRQGG